jgi:exonuclease V gamma subunit
LDVANLIRDQAKAWSSVTPPNAVAETLASALADTIESLAALRGELAFEAEPASFLAALQETRDITP